MNRLEQILTSLEARGVAFYAEGSRLRYRAPKNVLTEETRKQLTEFKDDLLAVWRDRAANSVVSHPGTYGQRALWFLHQAMPDSAAYNVAVSARIKSVVDERALRCACQALVDRHPALRTTFAIVDDELVQRVHGHSLASFQTHSCAGADIESLRSEVIRAARAPFDLESGPLMRVDLFTRSAADHVLLFTLHHICCDGWSVSLLLDNLLCLYPAERDGVAPEITRPVHDALTYSRWQKELLASPEGQQSESYWLDELDGEILPLNLPTDRPRPASLTDHGATLPIAFDAELSNAIRSLAAAENTTPFVVMLAAYQVLLHRLSGQSEIIVGSPTYGREHAEFANVVGYLVNMIPLKGRFHDNLSFRDFLKQMKRTTLEGIKHQDYPFPLLVEKLKPSRDPSRSPIIQTVFVLQRFKPSEELQRCVSNGGSALTSDSGRLLLEPFPIPQQEGQFELCLDLMENNGIFQGNYKYNTDLYDACAIVRLARHYELLLRQITLSPGSRISQLALLTEAERHQLVVTWNQTRVEYPRTVCIHELFMEQARRTPTAVAVRHGDREMTYQQLDRCSDRLAGALAAQGIGPGSLVPVLARRSPEMILGQLGVLKAGAAYVPVDPDYPPERIAFMLEDARASVLLIQRQLSGVLPATKANVVDLDGFSRDLADTAVFRPGDVSMAISNLAYVIYTSGSTGQPKGVAVEHANVFNLIRWHMQAYQITPEDRATQIASPAFDAVVWEMWPCLAAGASLHIPDEETRANVTHLVRWLADNRITMTFLPTPLAEAALDIPWPKHSVLRVMLTGGDKLCRHPREKLPFRLVNHYGPTENTVVSTCADVETGLDTSAAPPIGRPIPNTQAYILDRYLQPLPAGMPGELYVGGAQVARGYWNQPALTAEKFPPDPFQKADGARLYRTGDLCRCLSNGSIEYLGRVDRQIKIRGFRIEPGDIEAALVKCSNVKDAVVVANVAGALDKRLTAFLVPLDGQALSAQALREELRAKLPGYMVPSAFVSLEAFPVTRNGKIDRKALSTSDGMRLASSSDYVAPQSDMEKLIAGIWRQVLKVEQVGVDDNFFDAGGHSLLMTRVNAALCKALERDISMVEMFQYPTIGAMAEHLAGASASAVSLRRIPRDGVLPLSYGQQRLWFLHQLEPDSPAYNIVITIRLKGSLDADALGRALNSVVERHEVLRSTFASVNGFPSVVLHPAAPLVVERFEPRGATMLEREQSALEWVREQSSRPMNLEKGPLFRAGLIAMDAQEHWFVLVIHHIIADGWSLGVLVREWSEFYRAALAKRPAGLAPLPFQFVDFAHWQRQWWEGHEPGKTASRAAAHLEYWTKELSGSQPVCTIPSLRSRPAAPSYRGALVWVELDSQLSEQLRRFGAARNASVFMVMLTALDVLVHRYSLQEEVIIGTPHAGRSLAQSEGLIGLFLNMLPIRVGLGDDPAIGELLERVKRKSLDAFAHEQTPFEQMVEALKMPRDLSVHPLFQIMFAFQNFPIPTLSLPGLKLDAVPIDRGVAQFDLSLTMFKDAGRFRGTFEYSADLYDRETIERLARHYVALLRGIVEAPETRISALRLLEAEERTELTKTINATDREYPRERTVVSLIEEQAMRQPAAVAVSFEGATLSYGQLEERANRLARHLQGLGVGPGSLVGLCLERGLEMVIGVLGVLKSGAAYVPLDPGFPAERLGYMLADSGARVLVSQAQLGQDLFGAAAVERVYVDRDAERITAQSAEVLAEQACASDRAYVLYTSGSTGRPKGVEIEHGGLTNFLLSMRRETCLPCQ